MLSKTEVGDPKPQHPPETEPPPPEVPKPPAPHPEAPARPEPQAPSQAPPQEPPSPPQEPPPLRRRRLFHNHPLRAAVLLLFLVALLVGGYLLYRYLQTYESTDDATIDGHLNGIGARINGTIKAVYFHENQHVNAGDLLVELDPRDYQVAVQRAEAVLAQARAQVGAAQPVVPITQTNTSTQIATTGANVASAQAAVNEAQRQYDAQIARVAQAEANNARAQADLQRYALLVSKDQVSREDYDQRLASARSAAAMVDSECAAAEAAQRVIEQRRSALAQARSQLNQAARTAPQQVAAQRATVEARRADVQAAESALAEAKLNLSYTQIRAPVTGRVGRKAAEVGMRVREGQELLNIVPLEDIWVTARFKETQIRWMREGQSATIHVDAYGRDYEGYIEAMPAATAASFSVLPPENATGNFVKVVQRLPVRLRFRHGQDPDHKLRPGMSVEPKVWLK